MKKKRDNDGLVDGGFVDQNIWSVGQINRVSISYQTSLGSGDSKHVSFYRNFTAKWATLFCSLVILMYQQW